MIPYLQLAIGWLRDHWPQIKAGLLDAFTAIQPVLISIGQLIASIVTLIVDNWGTIGPVVEAVVNTIKTALKIIGGVIKLFAAILSGDWQAAWEALKGIVGDAFDLVIALLHQYAAIGGLLLKAVKAIADAILAGVVSGLKALPGLAWEAVKLIGAKYVQMYVTIAKWGFDLAKQIVGGVVDGLLGIGVAAWNVVNNIGEYLTTQLFRVRAWGIGIANTIKDAVGDGLVGIGTAAWNVINNIGSFIADKLATVAGWGKDIGKSIISGVVAGVTTALTALKNAVTGLFDKVIGWAKGALGIDSPSKEFEKIGRWMIEGLVKGVGGAGGFLKDAVLDIVKSAPGKLLGAIGGLFGGGGKGSGSPLDQLLQFARAAGITVTSTTSGTHTPTSYHYKGRAVDVAGTADQMRRFFLAALKQFGTRIKELFYDPMGYYIKNGAAIRGAIGGHGDHVHLALATGGIVTSPTRALIGEAGPEAVIPLGAGGGIQVRVFIGDTELKGIVRTEIVGENNRLAQTLLAGAV